MNYPSQEELQRKVKAAIDRLLNWDAYLLEQDVNERSISHKLASYLQNEVGDEWHVDCEYNRNHDVAKRLVSLPVYRELIEIGDTRAKTVFPDIIIHHRGTNKDNLLVIEMKKTPVGQEAKEFDLAKLKAFKAQYSYQHTLYLQLNTQPAGVDERLWNDREWRWS